jgi:hypothetical protein
MRNLKPQVNDRLMVDQVAALAQITKVLVLAVEKQQAVRAGPLLDLGWQLVQSYCREHGIEEAAVKRAMRSIESAGGLGSPTH